MPLDVCPFQSGFGGRRWCALDSLLATWAEQVRVVTTYRDRYDIDTNGPWAVGRWTR